VTPAWLNDIVREFGSGMGLKDFALNADGAAALRFENGVALRLEYAMNFLSLSMSVESPQDAASVKLLLTASDPLRRGAFAVRTGIAGNPPRAVFTVRLEPSEVTLGNLDDVMAELWRATENFSRRLGS
jgi:type III secretion system chaperone SycN